MKFKYGGKWGLTADECAYIYTICQLYSRQPIEVQAVIGSLVCEIGGEEYRRPLFECLTKHDSQLYTAQKYYMDCSTLSRLVKRFYVEYARRHMRGGA